MSHVSPSTLPGTILFTITPDDDTDLAQTATRGIYVGTSGDLAVIPLNGEDPVVLPNLAAGIIHPIRARRVRATGTTAVDIIGVA
jgi:hypothetical protein